MIAAQSHADWTSLIADRRAFFPVHRGADYGFLNTLLLPETGLTVCLKDDRKRRRRYSPPPITEDAGAVDGGIMDQAGIVDGGKQHSFMQPAHAKRSTGPSRRVSTNTSSRRRPNTRD